MILFNSITKSITKAPAFIKMQGLSLSNAEYLTSRYKGFTRPLQERYTRHYFGDDAGSRPAVCVTRSINHGTGGTLYRNI